MSNPSLSAGHQVSISHDPIEERRGGGGGRSGFARDNWPSGGRPVNELSSMLPSFSSADLRPALLAGAIGLFAAWVVAGMSASRPNQDRRRTTTGGRYVADRDFGGSRQNLAGQNRNGQARPQQTRGPRDVYSVGGPEGRSSRDEFEMDALNP
ncbi:MAG: hypothetical protein JWN07_158 [Hyphomicrobiales bacterium]|nr:hypothetical protein [Hyphomicrobiales bacterium]